MAYQKCNGINIYYEQHGSGTPLVLISGLGGDHFFWQSSIEVLSQKFRVITFDTRGIGKTDAPPEPYSMDIFTEDLLALMDTLQIEKAQLLGFSMGGCIALSFALKYPGRVEKLIVAGSHAKTSMQIRLFIDAVVAAYETGLSAKQMFNLICPWLFSNKFMSLPLNAAFLEYDENEPDPQPLYAWKNQWLALREYDVANRLHEIKLPTLILNGDEDLFASMEQAHHLYNNIKDSELKILNGAGHLINYESLDLFNKYVVEFLQK